LRRVVITGLGVVSPIGIGKNAYWEGLRSGTNGVARITHFDAENYPVKIAAEVKDFRPDDWMDHKEARRTDRVIHFTMAAGALAVEDGALDVSRLDKERFGVFLGSAEGGIFTSYENIKTLIEKGPNRVSPFFIPMMISNMPAAYLAIRYGAKGPNICVVTACATATHTIIEAFNTIRRGEADIILAGGAESAISPLGVAGFAAIKALSTRNDEPEKASRPFDADRDGFILGEGAGVLILEDLDHARSRGARIYAEISGYGSTCDAYHITAPDPEGDGAARAMKQAIDRSGWTIGDVDLINAHGTSTPLNDKMESRAIRTVFGDRTPSVLVNSTKSMIGHGLGAAGALETIAAIQSIAEGFVHPTLNLENQDPECDINVVGIKGVEYPVKRALVNNFGFGGHNGVLAIQSFSE
jgi:3-oxoacyl-[acyl-carrier-protein] synthase II